MILAHSLSEVELAFDLFGLHHLMVIFVSDALIILHHVVALVLLCIGTHITSILCLNASEVQDFFLFFFSLGIAANFTATKHFARVFWRKASWCEVLSVQYSCLLLVDQDKEQTL